MPGVPEGLEVECGRIDELISRDLVVAINLAITESEDFIRKAGSSEGIDEELTDWIIGVRTQFSQSSSKLEFSRSEDYFSILNEGILGNLVNTILPLECRENSDVFHLTALIIKTLAESQVFGDGNKRTSYLVGSLFLINHQRMKNLDPVYPDLNQEFVSILQDVAVQEEKLQFLENYLREGLEEYILD